MILKNLLPGKSVSIAAASSYFYLRNFPIEKISKVVDYIIYMTYDLHGQVCSSLALYVVGDQRVHTSPGIDRFFFSLSSSPSPSSKLSPSPFLSLLYPDFEITDILYIVSPSWSSSVIHHTLTFPFIVGCRESEFTDRLSVGNVSAQSGQLDRNNQLFGHDH